MFNKQDCNESNLYSLEAHFEKICNTHPHLKLLESQWRFDQELISKALQNVSSIFPHYSRHDASHSKQIIVNIERMLGEKIQYLSATDTWLILEAAYNHDIGMVITSKQLKDMETIEFREFVEDISKNKENNLNKFAKKWLAETAKLPLGSSAHSFISKYTQLLAEWYRKKHPENSAKIVRNPYKEIGLDSPRNELLPKRLFRVLANICLAHGQDFEDVKKLPKAEAGMATEDCHPRYVACLLRMGDLLDLDDNRFCPIMMHMCGHNFPKISRAHYDKHQSIKHFRLDSERIEVESESRNPEAYETAYEWFQWLQQEYHKQTQHWDDIVPSKELGVLPILTTPEVKIKEPYLILESGKKPNFKVDNNAILELVRGTGLYSSKFDSIREILQNAVDATLIAIWDLHNKEINELDPTMSKLYEIYKNYHITVSFSADPENADFWIFKVKDQGTGISFDTLKYMLNIGTSSKNKKKMNSIEKMPKWFRPSGNFGIGLQSTYLIADKFTIITKSRETHEALQFDFSKKSEKSLIIKKINSRNVDYGLEFEAKVRVNKFPETISLSHKYSKYITGRLSEYDFTQEGSDLRSYEIFNINSAILNFSKESPIPLNFNKLETSSKENYYFDKQENILFRSISFCNDDHLRMRTFFKGQEFTGFNYILSCVSTDPDFYGFYAKNFLTYNREKILPDAKKNAYKALIKSINNFIILNFDKIPEEQKPYAAAFYFLKNNGYKKIPKNIKESLYNFEVCIGESKYYLSKVINKIKNEKISSLSEVDRNEELYEDSLSHKQAKSVILDLIKYFITKDGWFYSVEKTKSYGKRYVWSKEDIQPVSNEILKDILFQKQGNGIGSRFLFPCWSIFRKLAIKANIPWSQSYSYLSEKNDYMVLPCLFDNTPNKCVIFECSESLIDWVYNHRKNKNVTLEEIRDGYSELITFLKKISKNNEFL